MSNLRAVRNIRLCTKDCLCLYVCPTHASDTENGQIDSLKCIGCGACVNACPSHAISLIPYTYPQQATKSNEIIESFDKIVNNKVEEKKIAQFIVDNSSDENEIKLAKAIIASCNALAEDYKRESGYMLPQSHNTKKFLESLKNEDGIPEDAIDLLLKKLY